MQSLSGTVIRFYHCHTGPDVIRYRLEVLFRHHQLSNCGMPAGIELTMPGCQAFLTVLSNYAPPTFWTWALPSCRRKHARALARATANLQDLCQTFKRNDPLAVGRFGRRRDTHVARFVDDLCKDEISRLDDAWTKYRNYFRQINDAEIQARPFYQASMPSTSTPVVLLLSSVG